MSNEFLRKLQENLDKGQEYSDYVDSYNIMLEKTVENVDMDLEDTNTSDINDDEIKKVLEPQFTEERLFAEFANLSNKFHDYNKIVDDLEHELKMLYVKFINIIENNETTNSIKIEFESLIKRNNDLIKKFNLK